MFQNFLKISQIFLKSFQNFIKISQNFLPISPIFPNFSNFSNNFSKFSKNNFSKFFRILAQMSYFSFSNHSTLIFFFQCSSKCIQNPSRTLFEFLLKFLFPYLFLKLTQLFFRKLLRISLEIIFVRFLNFSGKILNIFLKFSTRF